MSRVSTEQLVSELASDLEPVRPLPRLRVAGAWVVGVWALAVAGHWLFGGARPDPALPFGEAGFLAVLAGLTATAAGGIAAALASAIPGRESVARVGAAVGLAGLAIAAGAAFWAHAGSVEPGLGATLACLSRAAMLGVLPLAVACAYVARGVVRSPALAGAIAAGGTVALGTLVVHASCTAGGHLHILLGHSLAPAVAALALALPLCLVLRRRSRQA